MRRRARGRSNAVVERSFAAVVHRGSERQQRQNPCVRGGSGRARPVRARAPVAAHAARPTVARIGREDGLAAVQREVIAIGEAGVARVSARSARARRRRVGRRRAVKTEEPARRRVRVGDASIATSMGSVVAGGSTRPARARRRSERIGRAVDVAPSAVVHVGLWIRAGALAEERLVVLAAGIAPVRCLSFPVGRVARHANGRRIRALRGARAARRRAGEIGFAPVVGASVAVGMTRIARLDGARAALAGRRSVRDGARRARRRTATEVRIVSSDAPTTARLLVGRARYGGRLVVGCVVRALGVVRAGVDRGRVDRRVRRIGLGAAVLDGEDALLVVQDGVARGREHQAQRQDEREASKVFHGKAPRITNVAPSRPTMRSGVMLATDRGSCFDDPAKGA